MGRARVQPLESSSSLASPGFPPGVKFQLGKGAPSLECGHKTKHPIVKDTGFREKHPKLLPGAPTHWVKRRSSRRYLVRREAATSIHFCQTSLPPLWLIWCQPCPVSGHRVYRKMCNVGKPSCSLVWLCTSVAHCSMLGPDTGLPLLPLPKPLQVERKRGRWAMGTRDILQPLPRHWDQAGSSTLDHSFLAV